VGASRSGFVGSVKLTESLRVTRWHSGRSGWHPGLAAEQLDEDIEWSDVVFGRGGKVGTDGGERLRTLEALAASAHLLVNFGPSVSRTQPGCW